MDQELKEKINLIVSPLVAADSEDEKIFSSVAKQLRILVTIEGIPLSDIKACLSYFDIPEASLDSVLRNLDFILTPYNDTTSFRNFPEEKQKRILTAVFEHCILYTDMLDDIALQLECTMEELLICRKVLNTVLREFTVLRATHRYTVRIVMEDYGFSQKIANFIADVFCQYRSELQIRYLLRLTNNMKETVDENLSPILSALIEE